jgi:hypothetical protein
MGACSTGIKDHVISLDLELKIGTALPFFHSFTDNLIYQLH